MLFTSEIIETHVVLSELILKQLIIVLVAAALIASIWKKKYVCVLVKQA